MSSVIYTNTVYTRSCGQHIRTYLLLLVESLAKLRQSFPVSQLISTKTGLPRIQSLLYNYYGVLGSEHLECWCHFVLSCRLLCKRTISESDVTVADALLIQFCRRVERMYGKTENTPNMHMQCHLTLSTP